MTSNRFSCYIIGSESLLIQCADILLERGHDIRGIISAEAPIKNWATSQNIPVLAPGKSLAAELAEQAPFDYFLSITNLSIISDAILELPQKAAINFHDGPLPKYAGLYATSWALMGQEDHHGVSWHTMKAEVDEGLILKQQLFDIVPDETAFSLNVKAYENGIESFEAMVAAIESDSVEPITQDLAEQTYFGKYKRPFAAATIDWTKSAEEISALVRALDFGSYENPLTLAKLFMGEAIYTIPDITVLNADSTADPGTVTAVTAENFTVATATKDVQISNLLCKKGSPVVISDLDLTNGQLLPALSEEAAELLDELNDQLVRQETFWVNKLEQLSSVEIPYANRTDSPAEANYDIRHMPIVPEIKLYAAGKDVSVSDLLTTTFAAYLSRVSDADYFDVALSHQLIQDEVNGFMPYFSTNVPLRVQVDPAAPVGDTLTKLQKRVNAYANKRKSFAWDTFSRYPQLESLKAKAGEAILPVVIEHVSAFAEHKPLTGSELTLLVTDNADEICWVYDTAVYTADAIATMQQQFNTFLKRIAAGDGQPLAQTSILTDADYHKLISEWNQTDAAYDSDACMHTLISDQAVQRPDEIAVVYEDKQLTYQELDQRSNQLARHLQSLGVGPDVIVGVFMDRSLDLMTTLIGIHKAGGAYLPLDPKYPSDRIAFMVEDAGVPVLMTQSALMDDLPPHKAQVVQIDGDWSAIAQNSDTAVSSTVNSQNLAYVIYTSGSTGKPKGVMVQHGNAVNFFVGMDDRIPHDPPGTWLAVTSLSFDISVLELFWTLSRGFKVVIFDDKTRDEATAVAASSPHANKHIDFSLFYFASDESEEGVADKYNLLLEGAKFGDKHGFAAIWTPERHFHAFGGLYPNPSVASAAIAAITENIEIRAGSCVLPLHSPIRVAEEWSLVDNISKGRVGIAFAAGWQPNDFVLMPQNHAERKQIMFDNIEVVRKLWRGETLPFDGPTGEVMVRTLPRPIQEELPVWVTAAGNPETFRMAGEGGFRILTHLLGQTVEQLGEKLEMYRQGWRDGGHEGEGHVTLMLHTYVGEDMDEVRDIVREPMKDYLRSAIGLVKAAAWHFPTFKQKAEASGKNPMEVFESEEITDEEMEGLLEFAFNRYFETSSFFGTPAHCLEITNTLKGINVDEIACQIDFGVPSAKVLEQLELLNRVKDLATPKDAAEDFSIPAQIERHNVTHFQCTPSMARMLLMDERNEAALGKLDVMMVGGEAFPTSLANQLKSIVPGRVINMYGPTETTIWSTTHQLNGQEPSVSIGTPIANTQIYILDDQLQPVPVGLPGNLYIGGDGVVRGYLNRPELTAERFVKDPFREDENARMYFTGDLARYRADGKLDFLGRADFQVKLRGYRIELGEIESLINEHPTVNEAVVVAREDVPGDLRLVGYVIPQQGQTVVDADLKAHLGQTLPDFMVPARYVVMDEFPLTPNKKTDRKALPAPDQVQPQTTEVYVPPTNDLEKTIADIWCRLLNVPQVGLNDNFFELGGHSLLTVQAHRELKGIVSKPLAITDLFRFPTIKTLVEYLDESNGNGSGETAVSRSTDRAAARREAMKNRRGNRDRGRGRRQRSK